ncbi:hypothetical protein [Geobacter sp. DSM 9736]|uniref:hypothetical protein n=1 Tax=Geobacter sp. DSM 9736 TaxID=1277350 RepID=UPI0012FD52E8|nr:hypothetical protein [Geobacter sp. DSM 9736]
MAISGRNCRYEHVSIRYRHWLTTARRSKVSPAEMALIVDEVLDRMDDVITAVESGLPRDFPEEVAAGIFGGMWQSRDRLASQKHEQ